jgi:hypothetical protein
MYEHTPNRSWVGCLSCTGIQLVLLVVLVLAASDPVRGCPDFCNDPENFCSPQCGHACDPACNECMECESCDEQTGECKPPTLGSGEWIDVEATETCVGCAVAVNVTAPTGCSYDVSFVADMIVSSPGCDSEPIAPTTTSGSPGGCCDATDIGPPSYQCNPQTNWTLFHQSSIPLVTPPLNLAVCGGFPGIGQSVVQGHGAC